MQIGYFVPRDLDELGLVADWGYDFVETMPSIVGPPDRDDADAEELACARLRAAGVPVAAMCGFLPQGMMVVGPEADRVQLRAHVGRVFDRMRRLGIGLIGFGSPSSRVVPTGFPSDRAESQIRDFLLNCSDLGAPLGIRVCVEPQAYYLENSVNTIAQGLRLVREVDRPNIRLMADFAHMLFNGEPWDTLRAAGPYLIHAHIGDVDSDQRREPTTPAEQREFLAALRAAGYSGGLTLSHPLAVHGSPTETAVALRQLIAAAA